MTDFGCGARHLEDAGGRACGSRQAAAPLAAYRTIPERLRAAAELHPDMPALFDAETCVSYGELDRAVDAVAAALIDAGGKDADAVMLIAGVDASAIVAALGAMRAGKHFAAVEPSFPKAQIARIARDLSARLVVAGDGHEATAADALGASCSVLRIAELQRGAAGVDLPALAPGSIALLNYTSGSTGAPKGVVHTHASALSQAARYADAFLLGDRDRHAGFGSLAWAGSCWDAFGPLCVGSTAAVFDVRRHGLHPLPDWIERIGATVLSGMFTVRAVAREFPERKLGKVRLIQLGGDTVYRVDVEACRRSFPNAFLAVGFGTTETGRAMQHFLAPGDSLRGEVMPIGFALPGLRAWVVDGDGKEVDAGAVGEIVFQGDDLAAGYRGLPDLTAEKFRRDLHFGDAPVYFTGDLGRVLPDGGLKHLGRKDFQVKVRGYQVPVDEIEALLLAAPGVREACIVVQGPPAGPELLVAFVAGEAAQVPSAEALVARLRDALPDHMVPRRIVLLEALPKTPTAKTDRKALQEMPLPSRSPTARRTAPRSAEEAAIAAIWRDVLGIEEIGIDENFLDLGGDSLQAMQIAARVLRDFGLALPLSQLLARPTIGEMASLVAGGAAAGTAPGTIPKIPRRG